MGANITTHSQTKIRDLAIGTLSSKRQVSMKSFPPWIRELCSRGGGKSVGARRDGGLQGIRAPKEKKKNKTGTHINLQRLWQQAQGLCSSSSYGVLELKEVDSAPIFNHEDITECYLKLKSSFLQGSLSGKQTTLVLELHSQYMVNTKQTQQHLWRFLVL